MNQFTAIVYARTMEFIRDRGTFFWNLLFPIVLVVGFSVAFSGGDDSMFKVGIMGDDSSLNGTFLEMNVIETIPYDIEIEESLEKLRRHQIDMIVDFDSKSYYLNKESASSELLRTLSVSDFSGYTENEISGKAIRYVDWLVPGVIGMNMLFSCMFGVGFVIVRYRKNGVLKRMKATPVSPFTFITAQMASRFIIVLLTSIAVFGGTNIFLHFVVNGSYLLLILITALAILCMISFGLIFASRLKSEELASGLMNLLTFPMIIFSGVFFSLEGTPQFMQTASRVFPLTHFIEASRAVMIDGAGFMQILPNLIVLAGMTLLFLAVSSVLFKWE
ncbi:MULTISPECIES: ABC transporter permease [unclassified Oceanispirochaeta]|uniref:ABC transporter permease n=1 Tax=unclassified Oceanispirochaeta TaxID=2635722 RepID=UPI000E0954F2|nr:MULTISPECIES: ABC transporter permease [unclassified Oceanispirochaeta]MBF9015006.1 ABC transporter permease [Oceanispirochaeta sp. M2]NPD71313.1 ABC transporter permease [Oceanispirochaeta sp. M1]RDG33279.1 ABC transporter permease [Oceanispirochaeta sp. M1]